MPGPIRPTRVIVDLQAIAHNVRLLKSHAPQSQFLAVVKADGYGHGAVPVARAALAAGATWLAVAIVEEAVELRRAGIGVPILVLGYVPPESVGLAIAHDVRIPLYQPEMARVLAGEARLQGRPARVHIKVDTGMGRIGFQPAQVLPVLQSVQETSGLEIEGIFTHLAVADDPPAVYTQQQLDTFDEVLAALTRHGLRPPVVHAANSAGIMAHPRSHYDLVRGGIAIYGQPPDPAVAWPDDLRPALRWETRIAHVKDLPPGMCISYGCTYTTRGHERIATLPVGYADGYSRLLSNRGEVLVRGQRCPVVGRVCMDQIIVRLPLDLDVAPGEPVVLLGRDGSDVITAAEIAGRMGTINYEVLCLISSRVPRIYKQDAQVV